MPGGNTTIAHGKVMGRIKRRGIDEMGTYSCMNLKRENGREVMIITAYRVCKEGPKIGPFTAHMQQVKALLKSGVLTPNPRNEILKEFKRMIIKQHKKK